MKFKDFAVINPKVALGKGGIYSFIEMADIVPGNRYVQPKETRVLKGGTRFKNGDTLFARITPCLENGKIAQVKGLVNNVGFGSTEFYIFRGKEGVSNSDFVYYLSQTDLIRAPAEKSMTGATGRQRADLDSIIDLDVPDITIEAQIEIADVLSAYDNLIENNIRRIAILEEMAQSLYREWFIKFRFPGHDKAKFIDSPLGKIPEGWEVMAASKAIEINPRMKVPKVGEKPFVSMSGLNESSMAIGDIEFKSGNSGAKFTNGDTLFSRITPCLQNGKIGYVQFLDEEHPVGFGSTEFIVLRATERVCPEYVYLLSRTSEFRENAIKSMTGATGRQRVSNSCFDSYMLVIPNHSCMDKFQSILKPMFDSIFSLSKRNENLRRQRDMLMPKLISGAIKLN